MDSIYRGQFLAAVERSVALGFMPAELKSALDAFVQSPVEPDDTIGECAHYCGWITNQLPFDTIDLAKQCFNVHAILETELYEQEVAAFYTVGDVIVDDVPHFGCTPESLIEEAVNA
jgi:hypothetical protein